MPQQPECEPSRYGSVGISSDIFFSGSMFSPTQMPHWPMHMSRKSSQASASRCFTSFGVSVSRSLASAVDGVHVDRAAAFLHLLQHQVVAQAGGGNGGLPVGRVVVQHLLVLGHVVFAVGVGGLGLEQQEPGADRAVAVLEAGRHEAVFHHGHLGAGLGGHRVGRTGVPHRVPGAARAFADGARTEQVHAAAGGQQARPWPCRRRSCCRAPRSRPRRRCGSGRSCR